MPLISFDPDQMAREWLESIFSRYWGDATVASLSTLLRRVREKALEEAARIADRYAAGAHPDDEIGARDASEEMAAAIRAAKEGP